MNHVVIVGNGKVANDGRLGELIDAHPIVVRLNWFELKSGRRGRRTSIVVKRHAASHTHGSAERVMNFPLRWDDRATPERVKGALVLRESMLEGLEAALGCGASTYVTTGLAAICHFIGEHGRVSIVGFDGGKSGHYWKKNHRHVNCHLWEREVELIDQWERLGFVDRIS